MIVPESRNDEPRRRRLAALATGGVLVITTFVIGFVSVPDFTAQQNTYRKLNPARLAQLRPQPKPKPKKQTDQQSETNEQENPEEAVEDANPQKAPERVDMSEVSSQGLDVDLSPSETPSRNRSRSTDSKASGGNTSVRVQRQDVGKIGGVETFDDPNQSTVPRGRSNRAESGSEGTGIAVAEGAGSGSGTSTGQGFGDGGEVVGGSQGRAGNMSGTSVEVSLKDLDDFGSNYQNIEVKKLIQWMKEHPAKLPPGVKRHVGYQPNHLSSAVPIEVGNTKYELYLMCKESLYEIHIVLVRNQVARYVVDRSFQRQSRKFRTGTVRRTDGQINGIQSEAEPLGKQSKEFYQKFLSWWEEAKKDI